MIRRRALACRVADCTSRISR